MASSKRPKAIYVVSFLIHNPPPHKCWDRVDGALHDTTGVISSGDFGDGETALYYFRDDKETADKVYDALSGKGWIGNGRNGWRFKISDLKRRKMLPIKESPYWVYAQYD